MKPAVIVHGGAGGASPDLRSGQREGLRRAIETGWDIVNRGGSALDAVTQAVVILEDDPHFNAGYGSCLNQDGEIEMDASVMDGRMGAGAAGAVKNVKNPILLARAIMNEARHAMLVGSGAEGFARRAGLALVSSEELTVDRQRQRWHETHQGTVGAVACDRHGHVAAATSTGGVFGKSPGRVGDSGIIGSGTYADDRLGAASATGDGEAIIRVVLAKTAVELLCDGRDPSLAAPAAIRILAERGQSTGGVILIDCFGRMGHFHNTPSMSFAYTNGTPEEPIIHI